MTAPDNLPWLEDPWNRVAASLEQERLPHALLLSGPPGIGKRQLGERLVHGLLCLEPGAEPCGQCRSCRLLTGGAHPDRFVLEPLEDKRLIVVDQVRALLTGLVLTTTISPRKTALVYPAEAMNAEAANALLKTLEEPPGDLVLVLVSHDPSRLLPTIRSRCQLLSIAAPASGPASSWLCDAAGISETDAALALEAATGSPLGALELVREGHLDAYQALRAGLEKVIGKPSQVSRLVGVLGTLDAALGWTWLSLAASRALRSALGAEPSPWPDTDYTLAAAKLARLQQKADWGLTQLGLGLRQDLLLQEWLLEWARLPTTERIR